MRTSSAVWMVEEFIAAEDHVRWLLRTWRPQAARAVVAAVHDSGSDGLRYQGLAIALAAHGIATYAIDLRGGERTGAARRRASPWSAPTSGIRAMLARVRHDAPTLPVFLWGHGTGARLACQVARRDKGVLAGIICEGLQLHPSWAAAFWRYLPRRVALTPPLLLLHGSDDRIAAATCSEYLHARATSADKTLQLFEGGGHDLLNGDHHTLVQAKACHWIQAQLDANGEHRGIRIEYINE